MIEVRKPHIPRIHSFDILRGYFLFVILIDHLYYFPSGLDVFSGRGLLYVSSAEGFFLISGIILGIVRGSKLVHKPFALGAKLLLKRSLQLYITSIVLTLLFTFIGWMFFMNNPGLKFGIAPTDTPIIQLIWEALTYQYIYGWADFLRQYAIFIAIAPLALWLLRKGKWYVVAIASILGWLAYPLTSGGEVWRPLSWQLVFFSGFIIGFYWPKLTTLWQRVSANRREIIGRTLFATFVGTALISSFLVFGHYFGGTVGPSIDAAHHVVEQSFNKDRLPIARLLLGAIWFWGIFWLVRKFEPQIVASKVGKWLMLLGENSLYVYTIQAFVVFFMHLFIHGPSNEMNILVSLPLTLAATALVSYAVYKKFLFKIIPR